MANALEREDLKNITLLNSALRKKYGGEYSQTVRVRGSQSQVADRLGKFLDQEQHPGTFVPKSKIKYASKYNSGKIYNILTRAGSLKFTS